ncbi:MAG: hypothetical protein LBI27_01240 [Clostridiales bacterium]|jgi:hypothetical protein|nr:hypothetical protein [Clostridiales bacterium]
MAPEVAAGKPYDATVDRKDAIDKRLSGEPLPIPVETSEAMAQVILKACAFNPKDRYQSPSEFKEALAAVKAGLPVTAFVPTADNTFNELVSAESVS